MQLSSLSPRAVRLLALSIFLCAMVVVFTVSMYWPADPDGAPDTASKLIVVALFDAIYLLAARKFWSGFLVERNYGIRLSQSLANADFGGAGSPEFQEPALVSCLPALDERSGEDELRFPWPSLVTVLLLFAIFFIQIARIELLSAGLLFVFLAGCFFCMRPWNRWVRCLDRVRPYEDALAGDSHWLPFGKNLFPIEDSNFYRWHQSYLHSLGFELIGRRPYQHFFSQPGSCVFVTLLRDINARGGAVDFISFASIDEAGRVFESHSDPRTAKRLAEAHPLLKIQTIEAGDVGLALRCHQQFLEAHVDGRHGLVDASQNPAAIERLHEMTARATIRHFNEREISFA